MMPSKLEKSLMVPCAVLIVLGAAASVMFMAPEPSEPSRHLDLAHLSSSLRSRVREIMEGNHGSTAEEIEALVRADITSFLSSDLAEIDGYVKRNPSSIDVKVREDMLPLASAYPPETVLTVKGLLIPNSELSGSSGPLPALPVLRAEVSLELSYSPRERTEEIWAESLRFEEMSMDPERTLLSLISLIGVDMDGWGSGLARDMEYMLNSLVRMRTVRLGIGTRTFDTALNILNEGDIELAYNIAIGLSIARWTGTATSGLLDDIDEFYSAQELAVTMNPTGSRVWGESERDAFASYRDRTKISGAPRSISDLIGSAVQAGHSDSADIFLRYLHMDVRTSTGERLDPLDTKGPLEEMDLLNSRQRKDPLDTYSLEHHPPYRGAEGIPLTEGTVPAANGDRPMLVAEIGPTRGYSVVGRDVRVSGLNDYAAWFTNADPDISEEDLIAYGYDLGTRCGAILPPPEPPSHDYRIQWDLVVTAKLNLTGRMEGFIGSSLPQGAVSEERSISFPLRIHSWFQREPNRDGGIRLFNLNGAGGEQELTPISTRWIITPKANATEYFERFAFQDQREGISLATSLLRSLSYREGVLDPSAMRVSAQAGALSSIPALKAWIGKGDLAKDLAILYHVYLKGKGLKPESLGTIDTDGLAISLGYLQARDRMDMRLGMPEGSVVISISPISSSTPDATIRVTTPGGLEVHIEPTKGSFEVEGAVGGPYFKEGPLSPTQPTRPMIELVLEGSTFSVSPPIPFGTSGPSSPFEPARPWSGTELLASPTVHLLLGGDTDDIESVRSMMPEFAPSEPDIPLTELLALSAGKDLWSGAVIIWNGENGTTPLSRTVLFRVSEGADLSFARAALLTAVWSPYMDLGKVLDGQERTSLEVMTIDRAPSWSVALGTSLEGSDVMFACHYRYEQGAQEHVLSLNVFQQASSDAPVFGSAISGWTMMEQKAASPLW